jgi:cytoplasmic tRNA 2-thiolation protein 2
VQEWKARISIRSLRDGDEEPPPSESSLSPIASLMPHLCYACHTTLTSRGARAAGAGEAASAPRETIGMPVWVGPCVTGREGGEVWRGSVLDGEGMRRGFEEYLLDG